jgi:hypothetical protein
LKVLLLSSYNISRVNLVAIKWRNIKIIANYLRTNQIKNTYSVVTPDHPFKEMNY